MLGERSRVEGWGLGGARVLPAESATEVRAVWAALPADVAVVLVTPAAARALGPQPAGRPLLVVLPS